MVDVTVFLAQDIEENDNPSYADRKPSVIRMRHLGISYHRIEEALGVVVPEDEKALIG